MIVFGGNTIRLMRASCDRARELGTVGKGYTGDGRRGLACRAMFGLTLWKTGRAELLPTTTSAASGTSTMSHIHTTGRLRLPLLFVVCLMRMQVSADERDRTQ